MRSKNKFKNLIIFMVLYIILATNISLVYASPQVMIYKDGRFIWIDADSEEARERFRDGILDNKPDTKTEYQILAKKREIEAAPVNVIAKPTNQTITVDGVPTKFRAYNIDGFNYFMLRDIAHVFKETKAQFEVGWDQARFAINLETGKSYTGAGVGFDMKTPHIEEKATKSKATIYKNGEEALLLGYTIQGYTYFKLRDLGEELGFGVHWDDINKTIVLLSDKDATLPEPKEEPKEEPKDTPKEESKPEHPDPKYLRAATESEKQKIREDMLALINKERRKEGLHPLVLDDKLIEMAEYKAADMKKLNKGTHSGSYGSFDDLLDMFNINYRTGGENILKSGISAENMFTRWWNSSGHRANMMNPDFRKIGIGLADDKVVTTAFKVVPSDIEHLAIYNKSTGLYEVTAMGYWAAQEFTD